MRPVRKYIREKDEGITMAKIAKTTTTTTSVKTTTIPATITEVPTDITVAFARMSSKDLSLDDANLLLNVRPIKNIEYFKKGIIYFNLRALKNQCIDIANKTAKAIEKATTAPEKKALEEKLENVNERKTDMDNRINSLNLSEKEIVTYTEDNYLQLIAHSVGWKSCLPVSNMESVMLLLEKTRNNGTLSTAIKKDLKTELDKICEFYKTEETAVYHASRVHFNMHMVTLIHHLYFNVPKLSKDGVYTESWQKQKHMSNIIMTVLCAKIQNKITTYND